MKMDFCLYLVILILFFKTFLLGDGIANLEPGQFSDDTEMALCLARSLDKLKEYNKADVTCSYVYWMQTEPICAGKTSKGALLYSML